MLRDAWPTIAGKTALSTREIEDARRVADQLLDAVGVRDQAPVVSAATSDARARAYTLFFNAYDEARAAIHYLRRHIGDAEKIAPSLYAGRGGRGKKEEPAQRPPAKPSEHVSPIDATQPVATVPHTMPQAADASDDGPFVHN
jgi:hypothetical protein